MRTPVIFFVVAVAPLVGGRTGMASDPLSDQAAQEEPLAADQQTLIAQSEWKPEHRAAEMLR
jgi:hypothetical protein